MSAQTNTGDPTCHNAERDGCRAARISERLAAIRRHRYVQLLDSATSRSQYRPIQSALSRHQTRGTREMGRESSFVCGPGDPSWSGMVGRCHTNISVEAVV